MYKYLLIILISTSALSTIVGDKALYMIATNTLNSVRELNSILTESREFHENFESVYSKVDTAIWKVDRTSMWLEDMKELAHEDIENLDDFNYVLRQLKDNTAFIRRKLIEEYNRRNNSKENGRVAQKERRRAESRVKTYQNGTKGSMSPSMAAVETAKNTKDLTVETARVNVNLAKLNQELAKISIIESERKSREDKKKLKEREKLGNVEKGVLRKQDVRTR